MTHLTRREFGKAVACGIGALSVPLGFAVPTAQADSAFSDGRSKRMLENQFGISLTIEPEQGCYSIRCHGQRWLGHGAVSVLANNRWYRSAELNYPETIFHDHPPGKLVLAGVTAGRSKDSLGSYESVELTWKVPDSATDIITGFRLYSDAPCLVFVQRFPHGFENYASGQWTVPAAVFPQFLPQEDDRNDLYAWVSEGMFSHRFGHGSACSSGGTVDLLVLADAASNTLILSPSANYLVATQQSASEAVGKAGKAPRAAIHCGIEGLVKEIPAGFEHQHILVVGTGIHRTFASWGKALLRKSGKQIPSKYTGDNLKYPVYWDDYGAYYREHGFKEEGFHSYEEIILAVGEDAKKHGLKIGAYQVQDLDQLRYREGLFEPRQDLFPHGLAWLRQKLGAPLEAYNAWLPPNGPYREKYPFFATPQGDVPNHSMGDVFYSLEYWRDTAAKMASWGVTLLQQDFQNVYEANAEMMSGLSKMNDYFRNMALALQEKSMTLQYCMQCPRNILQSTENPIVTSLQGSLDHHVASAEPHPQHQDDDPFAWKHLIFTSAFYGAVGIWPSRDNIQTVADPNAYEDMLLANLLGGEIQLGHRIGQCDFELVRRTYREGDCLVLKPDRPIVPLDRCYIQGGVVGYSESSHNGNTWYYVLSLPVSGYLAEFCPQDTGGTGSWAVYNYQTKAVSILEAASPIALQRGVKHEYFVLAPLFNNGMAVFGDVEKFVTMAEMRMASVEASGEGLRVGVISNQKWNPLTVGYAARRPAGVEAEGAALKEASSLQWLTAASSGWFWDRLTKLWHVKMNFAGLQEMTTKQFILK
jgi:hypothetical protein